MAASNTRDTIYSLSIDTFVFARSPLLLPYSVCFTWISPSSPAHILRTIVVKYNFLLNENLFELLYFDFFSVFASLRPSFSLSLCVVCSLVDFGVTLPPIYRFHLSNFYFLLFFAEHTPNGAFVFKVKVYFCIYKKCPCCFYIIFCIAWHWWWHGRRNTRNKKVSERKSASERNKLHF